MKSLYFLLLSFFVPQAFAELPEYSAPLILARANIHDGYNLPAMTFLNNTSPVINDLGEVAFKIMAVEGQNDQAIWVKPKDEEFGKIAYVAPEQRFITDPSINDEGKIGFNLHDEGVTDGLFILNSKDMSVDQVLSPDIHPIKYYTYPQILNNGHIFFRATDDSDDRSFYEFDGKKLNKILAEGEDVLGVKSSYLFKPSLNHQGMMAFKSRLGTKGSWDESAPDQIQIMLPQPENKVTPYRLITIAKDVDSDPSSPYARFGNSVSIATNGAVAFSATLNEGKKAIIVYKENIHSMLAIEGQKDIAEIEMFAPKINNLGQVVFRAKDTQGVRGIYIADGSGVKKLIGEGDLVETDIGPGKILNNPNFPGFGGEIDMNNNGEIVFYCIILDNDNKELGSAVYKLAPKI